VIKINEQLLVDVGLGELDKLQSNVVMTQIYLSLEIRVGTKLAETMTTDQLAEFETYFDAHDDASASSWLEREFPDYKRIVGGQFEALREELIQDAPEIAETVRDNASTAAMTRFLESARPSRDAPKGGNEK
jgi:hypothetical protein